MKNYNFINGVDAAGNDVELDWKSNYEENQLRSSDYILLSKKQYLADTVERVVKMNVSTFINLLHPVGSVLMTVDTDFDPNKIYPGTSWTKWTDGYLKVDETPSSTASGGYTISSDMLPQHTHGLNSHTHSFTPNGSVSTTTNLTGTFYVKDVAGTGATGVSINASGNLDANEHSSTNGIVSVVNGAEYKSLEGNSTKTLSQVVTINANHAHAFTGSAGTTGAASGNTTSGDFSNSEYKPKYYAVIAWQRTA